MKCKILHETTGRLRVHLCCGRMTVSQADVLEYYLRAQDGVQAVKVYDRTQDAVVLYVLYQIMTFVQAPTFELFVKNMGQLMMEKITNADMIVFNRCDDKLKESLRARNLRMVNRRADIYLEDNDGNSEDYLTGDECPFDMTPDLIDIPDDDYGVWYVDAMDHPDRWDGKKVHMKLIMCHSKKFPGIHCPGRFVMTCCENDIQFVGIVAKGDSLKAYKNRDWVDITATVKKEHLDAYEGEGPVLYVERITTTSKPAQEVVTF